MITLRLGLRVKMSQEALDKRAWPIEGTFWKYRRPQDIRGEIISCTKNRVRVRWDRYKTPVSYSEGAALELLEEA